MCSRLTAREKLILLNPPKSQSRLFRMEWQPSSISRARKLSLVNSALTKTLALTPAQSALTKTKDFNPTEISTCKQISRGRFCSASVDPHSIRPRGKDDRASTCQNRVASTVKLQHPPKSGRRAFHPEIYDNRSGDDREAMAMTGIPGRTGSPVRARERTSGREGASELRQPVKGKSAGLLHLLKEAWPFLRPQRMLLLLGLVMMAINRLAGLVLPASTKFLVDNVIGKRQVHLLGPLALAIIAATVIQGITSFTLTQLLSKAAQRMIAELRRQVQAHIGRLSISFHDVNKTGNLVARIMSDVEGLRNLMGTGLVELVGSLMTALFALIVLLRISAFMTAVASAILLAF